MRPGSRRIRVLAGPARASIETSLVINTDRRTHLIAPVVRSLRSSGHVLCFHIKTAAGFALELSAHLALSPSR